MPAVKSRNVRTSDRKKRPVTRRVDPSIVKKGKAKATAKATAKKRPAKKAPAKATAPSKMGERIVRLRDKQGKDWATVIETVGLSGSQVRRLYRANGGKGRRA